MASVDVTRIASNIGALNSLNSLQTINQKLAIHQTRLATGKRINSAADDPAGLTIATKMLARSEGLKTALDNIGDAKNMLSVAEAGLSKVNDILVQMRNKAEQAASDTLGASERSAIQTQLQAYAAQIDDIVEETKWNGVKLLDGTVNKRFQTGVDEGEHTVWQLTQEHTAGQLNVSEAYDSVGFDNVQTSASLTGASEAGVATGFTQAATGSYSFEILAKATDDDQGSVDVEGAMLGGLDDVTHTAAAPTEELASGRYRMTVTANDTGTHRVSYTIRNLDTDTIVETVAAGDITGGDLIGGGAGTLGVSLDYTTDSDALQVGQTMDFEYVAAGQVKVEMNDASGQAMQINSGGTSSSYAYTDAGAAYDSGRGIQTTIAAIGTTVVGQSVSFEYHQAGDHVVDVSTASKAASYMTDVTNALDVVNSSMADLGSLMARMTFKEDQISTAQVNVESSYNRIMNANMAEEQVNASKFQILQQTATAMLAQANSAPQFLLSLFR